MKKRKLFYLIILIILFLPTFVIITFGLNDDSAEQDDLENIEKLIIIRGIEYPDNNGKTGRIIFQDSFDEFSDTGKSEKKSDTNKKVVKRISKEMSRMGVHYDQDPHRR